MPRLSKLELQLKTELAQARKDYEKACRDAGAYKKLYENQVAANKRVRDDLNHQERLVRTLLDALADQYYPLPTSTKDVNIGISYRVVDTTTIAEREG